MQGKIRTESYEHIRDAIYANDHGSISGREVGQRVILPASFAHCQSSSLLTRIS
jgi:hypothetical protein